MLWRCVSTLRVALSLLATVSSLLLRLRSCQCSSAFVSPPFTRLNKGPCPREYEFVFTSGSLASFLSSDLFFLWCTWCCGGSTKRNHIVFLNNSIVALQVKTSRSSHVCIDAVHSRSCYQAHIERSLHHSS